MSLTIPQPVKFLLGFYVLALFALTFFSLPAFDDLFYTSNALTNGFWKAQWIEYFRWGGRYIATSLLSLSPLSFGISSFYYFLPLSLNFALNLFSIHFLVNIFLENSASQKTKWLVSLALFATILNSIPGLSETIFWFAGALTYTFALSLFLLSLVGLRP